MKEREICLRDSTGFSTEELNKETSRQATNKQNMYKGVLGLKRKPICILVCVPFKCFSLSLGILSLTPT